MEEQTQDKSILGYIKNVRTQMSKISSAYEEDTPLNKFLQAKYEKNNQSPYNSNNSYSNAYENSFMKDEHREDFYRTREKLFETRSNENKTLDLQSRNFELESRISELLRIQDSLMKNLEENKRKALQAEQYDRKLILELKEKLSLANTKVLNLEEALQSGDREKMRKYIKELEITKEALRNENEHMIRKMQEINKELELIEIQSKSMNEELQSLKQQNSSLYTDLVSVKSEKVELLKQIDSANDLTYSKDSLIQSLSNRIEDLKSLIQSTSFHKFSDISHQVNSQVEALTKENEALKNMISQKPTNSDILCTKKKLMKLEKAVDNLNSSSNGVDRSKSCEKKSSFASQNKILRDLTSELGISNPFTLLETLKKINQENKNFSKSHKFIDKLKKAVSEAGVEDFFTLKKLWKWLKNVLNDYFLLKKRITDFESSVQGYLRIKAILNINEEDLPGAVSRIIVENEYLKLLINKAKIVIKVNRKSSLQEFEMELDNRL